jgi:hypothetical protein
MSRLRPLPSLLLAASVALAGVVVSTVARPARASIVLALELPELVYRSDRVVLARVVSVRSAWDAAHEHIDTRVEIQVDETWKGGAAPSGRIVVTTPGGTADGITMRVIGAPRFSEGERAVLFLKGTPGASTVVGMAQGKRPILPDPSTGVLMAHGGAGGATTLAPDANGQLRAAPPDGSRPLRELRSTVLSLVGKAAR